MENSSQKLHHIIYTNFIRFHRHTTLAVYHFEQNSTIYMHMSKMVPGEADGEYVEEKHYTRRGVEITNKVSSPMH